MKPTTTLVLMLLIALPLIYAEEYGNPRMDQGIASYGDEINSNVIELAKCYSDLKLIAKGISFSKYYEDFVAKKDLPADCKVRIEQLGDTDWYQYYEDNLNDADGDDFTDVEEQREGTNANDYYDYPWWIDIDGDGYNNDLEILRGSDPLNPNITPDWKDSDNDGYGDSFEYERGSNPYDEFDVPQDVKSDTTGEEKSSFNWKLWALIILGIVLLIITLVYFLVIRKKDEI
jgi:hypothetical protein